MSFPSYGVTVPSLQNWQLSYNGLTMGAGTAYGITGVEGWGDMPVVNKGDMARDRDQGELLGLDFMQGRDITFDLYCVPGAGSNIQTVLETLATATMPISSSSELPLWFQLPNLPLMAAMCRPRKRPVPYSPIYASSQVAKPSVFWHATDPRLYAAPQQSTVGLPTPIVGVTFPLSFNVAFGGGSSVAVLTLTNSGNVEMRPVMVLTGPMTNPTVQNVTAGWSLSFNNPSETSYTLNAGDTLTIDTDLRTVTYVASGTTVGSPRVNWLVPGSTWPSPVAGIGGLVPGANTIQFSSQDSGSVAGTLAVQYASAYVL